MKIILRLSCLVVLLLLSSVFVFSQSQTSLPDLIVTAMRLNPEAPEPSEIVTVTITVTNQGNAAAGPFRVAFTGNGTLTKQVDGLNVGASATVSFSWFEIEGEHTIKAEVDPLGDVEESDSDNNILERTVFVAREPLPDLVIESVQLDPENPLPLEPTTITITVRNQGSVATTRTAVLRISDDSRVLATLFVSALEVGESQSKSASWTPELGERRLSIEIDQQQRIEELDEDNNLFTQIITISNTRPTGANLVVENIIIEPESPMPGEVVTLSAGVTNNGVGIANDFVVVFETDGAEVSAIEIDTLAPNESQTIMTTFIAPLAGERLIRVKVDGGGTIAETDEEDNVISQFVQVGDTINECGQQVWLKLEDEAADILASTLRLTLEEVHNVYMPKVRAVVEEDFEDINIRFALQRPVGRHSRLDFVSRTPTDNRLGEAPLDFQNRNPVDVGFVFVVAFERGLANGQIFDRSLDELAQALGKVASHEAGHFLGLDHDDEATTARFGGANLMAPSVETFTAALFSDSFFTEENLEYLRRILPFECNR